MYVLTDREWGWIAGIIDGEGSLSLSLNNGTGPGVTLTLTVGNTCERLIDRLHSLIGGVQRKTTYQHQYKGEELPIRKATYFWTTADRTIIQEVLTEVLPLLTEKQERARVALEYLQYCPPVRSGRNLTDQEAEARRDYYQMMRELNRKGAMMARDGV